MKKMISKNVETVRERKRERELYFKKLNGITLIALVITIIILMILAGVAINLSLGYNGILNKAKLAKEETRRKSAEEAINLKITNIQIKTYTETGELPTLQILADEFCEDGDFEEVIRKEPEVGRIIPKIEVGNTDSIEVKLEAYPYWFEINSSLQLASIDGRQVASATPQIPEGYIKPVGTRTITEKAENIDVSGVKYVDTTQLYTKTEYDDNYTQGYEDAGSVALSDNFPETRKWNRY